jgi:uracil phosphoribosyltransferase
MGFEVSKRFYYNKVAAQTPLDIKQAKSLEEDIVISSILRAGLPMHEGLLETFDKADNAFISAYRIEDEEQIKVKVEYESSPDLNGKTLLLADPMIATGRSILSCLVELKKFGQPKRIFLLGIVASQAGINKLNDHLQDDVECYIADIDPDLNDKSYIVPGLGDAGDLAFGNKL